MKRIFDPGFTTKGGGRIDAVSTPGEGSSFTIRIPIEPQTTEKTKPDAKHTT